MCFGLIRYPLFEGLQKPVPGTPPNYVLRNDFRYREVWRNYVRLIRREDEEDRLWDWQSRTWADVFIPARGFLISCAIPADTSPRVDKRSIRSI